MASTPQFAEYVFEKLAHVGEMNYRRMFGSYGIYMDRKFIGLISEDQLFIKPTNAGRKMLTTPLEAPPFDGAKDWFLIEDLEDSAFLVRLLVATWEELPFLKAKKPKRR